MSNTMTAHEPIHYLDSILNEEESRCEYGHQWRNFTISRSGRFRSKNKKRDIVDGKFFDTQAAGSSSASKSKDELSRSNTSSAHAYKEQDKMGYRQPSTTGKTYPATQSMAGNTSNSWARDKPETYKSFYETNL